MNDIQRIQQIINLLNIKVFDSRSIEYVYIRQLGHFFAKKYTNLSLSRIGFFIGRKDHATVLHSIKVINNYIQTDKKKRNEIKELDEMINYKFSEISLPAGFFTERFLNLI